MDAAALIPIKRFEDAKGRLAPALTPDERVRLARWLAGRVLAAATPLPVFVACDDEAVAEWSEQGGATVLWSPGMGLNGAVDASRETIAGKGFDHLVIAHSDLPLARELRTIVEDGTVSLVPDRRRDGTNVLAMPVNARITASYGANSFQAHLDMAVADNRYGVQIVDDERLAHDVDTPDDLADPILHEVLPTWLRTILASQI
ncbi:2-phospho-L-lactate guanylyltransferase [soil metagenome]